MRDKEVPDQYDLQAKDAFDKLPGFWPVLIHEIRSPTHSLTCFLELLERDLAEIPLPEEAQRSIRFMNHAVDRLRKFVRAFGQLVHSLDSKSPQPQEILPVIQEAWQSLHDAHEQSSLELDCDSLAVTVNCDRDALLRVFGEIFQNALQFRSTERNLQIFIRARKEAQSLCLVIQDNGQGFAPEQATLALQPFKRLAARSEEHNGPGLGLTIASLLLKHCQGELAIESDGQYGTTVTLSFPIV
ncbi:MAG: HAMP domain-containing histidine kinase [Planctomycetales bacterium]|nr:HAMP domain-containing histidine kinase [Planctomycetales bacterium]